jgi:hypothetical protein
LNKKSLEENEVIHLLNGPKELEDMALNLKRRPK